MAIELTRQDARRLRWQSQLLGGSELAPADVVRRAVALQGQDLPAVLEAIAIRSRPGTGVQEVRDSFDRGELVRSWPMRGTLFATTPEHLAALLCFTGDRIRAMAARRRAELGLDEAVISRGRETLREALAERPLLRAEALAVWEAAGIPAADGRGYHLLMHLSVEGLMHWGAFDPSGSQQYLTLSHPRTPDDPDAALAEVVRGFVRARGPVTEADLAWWTKLPKATLRRAAAGSTGTAGPGDAGAPATAAPVRRSVLREAADGLQLAWSLPQVRAVLGLLAAVSGLVLPLTTLLVPLLARSRGWDAAAAGTVAGGYAAGMAVIVLIIVARGQRAFAWFPPVAGLVLCGGAMLAMACVPGVWLCGGLAVVAGLGTGVFSAKAAPLLLLAVPESHVGRIQSVALLAQMVPLLVANNLLGWLSEASSPTAVIAGCGTATALIAGCFLGRPSLRGLGRHN